MWLFDDPMDRVIKDGPVTISFFRSERKDREDRVGVKIVLDFGETDFPAHKSSKALGQVANTLRNIFGIDLSEIKS